MKKQHPSIYILSLFIFASFLLYACGQATAQTADRSLPNPSSTASEAAPVSPSPATLPAGCKKIAFVLSKEGQSDLYSVCPDGSQLLNLTNDAFSDSHPAWSPDGSHIAFASSRSGGMHIFVMKADGSDVKQISTDYENSYPLWLPNGRQIAFRTTDGKGLWWWRRIDFESGQVTPLSEPSFDFFFQTPSWSPEGGWIATMSLEEQKQRNDGSSQIHIQNEDGSVELALTHDTWANITPRWSPDGSRIAFLSERDGSYNLFALYVINRDGSNLRRLSSPIYSENTLFSWSPDGEQIVIGGEVPDGNLYLITLQNASSQPLLNLSPIEMASAPSWQP